MRIVLDLTPEQYRAAFDLTAATLRFARVREDPASLPLRQYFDKLAAARTQTLCTECEERIVYARRRCKSCYRKLKSA